MSFRKSGKNLLCSNSSIAMISGLLWFRTDIYWFLPSFADYFQNLFQKYTMEWLSSRDNLLIWSSHSGPKLSVLPNLPLIGNITVVHWILSWKEFYRFKRFGLFFRQLSIFFSFILQGEATFIRMSGNHFLNEQYRTM